MTLNLELSPELEQYLTQEADRHGLSIEDLALQLLGDVCLPKKKQIGAINPLQSWIDDDNDAEQQETGQYLIEALDQDRLWQKIDF